MATVLDAATIAKAARSDDSPPWEAPDKGLANVSMIERYGGVIGGTSIALYDPHHPSVLFDKLRKGLSNTRFVRLLKRWAGKPKAEPERPKHSRIIGKDGGRRLLESGLIIPSQRDVFLLSRPHSAGDYLIDQGQEPVSMARRVPGQGQ